MTRLLFLSLCVFPSLSACASSVTESPPVLDAHPALGSGVVEPGSYSIAIDVPPGDPLHDEVLRMDVGDDLQVAFAAPWQPMQSYWVRDAFDAFELPHDVSPGRCTSCYVVGWAPQDGGVRAQLMGLEGLRARDGALHYDRGRAAVILQLGAGRTWTGRTVAFELLADHVAPELRLRGPSGPLLPWSTLTVEPSEPLTVEPFDVAVRADGPDALVPRIGSAAGSLIAPSFGEEGRRWWPLGGTVRIGYRGGAMDAAGNEASPRAWTLGVVPDVPARPIGGTGGLVHWGNLEFERGSHQRVRGPSSAGFFAHLDVDTPATAVSARISVCGSPGRHVTCTSTWAFPDGEPRTQTVDMTVDRLPADGGCFAAPQVISLGWSSGETITGPIGVAATFDDPDGGPADDVHVVVHTLWADDDFARGGS